MPNTKSAAKALRQTAKRKVSNLKTKRAFRAVIKEFRQQVIQKNYEQARSLLPAVYKKVDKASKNGVLKKNTASRYKSRLSRFLKKSTATPVS